MQPELRRVGSFSELIEMMRTGTVGALLGSEAEGHRDYLVAMISPCAVGICSQGRGITPSVLMDPERHAAWIGFNAQVARLDTMTCRVLWTVSLDSTFFALVPVAPAGFIVVVHELGAVGIDATGAIRWQRDTDVIIDFSDQGNALRLLDENGMVLVDKISGKILS